MPDESDQFQDPIGAPVQAPAMAAPGPVQPPQFNTDITKGPTWSTLPAPYQPPPGPQGFDSTGFLQEAFRTLPLDVAMKASEAAIQLEGQLGYAADVKAGVPEMQALTRWAPKIYHRNPAVVAHLMQANKPAFQPEEITLPSGQKVTRVSPNRVSYAPKGPRTELTPGEQIHALSQEMRGLEKQIAAESDLKREEALRQKYAAKVEELSALRGKSGGVRVKEKKTGKIHRYSGNPADLTDPKFTADYEVLQ